MKNKVAVWLLLIANFISGIAQGISMIAIPIHFAANDQSRWFNWIYLGITVISLFWSLFAGTLIDKYNRKNLFIGLNLFNGCVLAGIAYFDSSTDGYTSYFAALSFGLTFWNYNLHYPAFYAIMQEMTESKFYRRIASYIEVQSQMASALAGAAAAMLLQGVDLSFLQIAPWELYQVFAFDALTYFAALAIILCIHYTPLVDRKVEDGSITERLKLGFTYLKQRPDLFLFGVLSQCIFVVVLIYIFNLCPIYIKQVISTVEQIISGDKQTFAIAEMFYALGAITSGLSVSYLLRKLNMLQIIQVMIFITIIELLVLIFTSNTLLLFIVSLFLGITNAGSRVIRVSFLFSVLPNQVIGRCNSIFFVCNTISRLFFLSLFGLAFFHEEGNVIFTFAILIVFMLLCSIYLWVRQKQIMKLTKS